MENFIERLQYYMKDKGINDNQLTVAASLSIGLIGKAKLSGKGMSSSNIEKILLAYPDLNSNWLLTGKGSMLNNERQTYDMVCESEAMYRATPISRINNLNSTISIPIVDISVAAGINGCINSDNLDVIDNINLPASMVKSNARYFCVRTRGESMAPTILDSSYVILRLLESQE